MANDPSPVAGRPCPWCDSGLDDRGVCTDRDCPFVACPVCADGAHGYPIPERLPWTANCAHLVIAESGEEMERYLVESAEPSALVLDAPPDEWFDLADELDLTAFGTSLGLGSALATVQFTSEGWTQDILGALGGPAARSRSSAVLVSQMGVATTWDADPIAFWGDVDRAVASLIAHVNASADSGEHE
jgi:hypothetical protein